MDVSGTASLSHGRGSASLSDVTPAHSCCIGVDVPGIGHVHAADCRVMSWHKQVLEPETTDMAPEHAVLILAERERQCRREQLLCELIFAARALADHALLRTGVQLLAGETIWCRECHATVTLGRLIHGDTCRVGRVQRVVDALLATATKNLTGEEAAAQRSMPQVADGIRPPARAKKCMCGATLSDFGWERRELNGVPVWIHNCDARGVDNGGAR